MTTVGIAPVPRPSISVIVPVYNGGPYLTQALQSIFAQTLPVDQVIVVDDGSTDDSARIAQTFSGVKVIQRANGGAGAARNTGLEHAHGDWIAFLDADDFWYPQKLELQRQVLDQTDVALCFTHVKIGRMRIDGELETETESIAGPTASSFLGKRACFDQAGKFNEDRSLGEFIEWMTRVEDAGLRSHLLAETLWVRRIHENNTGIRQRHQRSDYARLVRTVLSRRRANPATPPASQ